MSVARGSVSVHRDLHPQVIFNGTKMFWRSNHSVDVWIVEHRDHHLFEIISIEPTLNIESSRIYLDAQVLKTKIDKDDIDGKLITARRMSIYQTPEQVRKVIDDSIVKYVLPRIVVDNFANGFQTRWQFLFGDFDGSSQAPLIVHKPDFLIPYKTRHNRTDIFNVVIQAKSYGCAESSELSALERWRIPVVLGKVNRWVRLQVGDQRIFQKIRSNMRCEEDVDKMEIVMNKFENSAKVVVVTKSGRTTTKTTAKFGLARNFSSSGTKGHTKKPKRMSFLTSRKISPQSVGHDDDDADEEEERDTILPTTLRQVAASFSALGSSLKESLSSKKNFRPAPINTNFNESGAMFREVKCQRPLLQTTQTNSEVDLDREQDSVKVSKLPGNVTLMPTMSGLTSTASTPSVHSRHGQIEHYPHPHPLQPMPTVKSGLRIKPVNRAPSMASILLGLLGWGSTSSLHSSDADDSRRWVAGESVKEEEEEDVRST